jgi:putative serine protease PepD
MTMIDDAAQRPLSWRDLPPNPPYGTNAAAFVPAATAPAATTSVAPPRPGFVRRHRRAIGVLAVAGVLVGSLAVVGAQNGEQIFAAFDQAAIGASPAPGETDPGAGAPPVTPGEDPVADAADKLTKSVVQIEARGQLGAGVILDAAGYIVTCDHVVGRASTVSVRFSEDDEVQGTVVARDSDNDLAIVKIDREDLVAAETVAEDQLRVGQQVIAVGSPLGFSSTVTTGIISALDRSLDTPRGHIDGLIQTDAPINPGNSGGPLADTQGRVAGINDAIASLGGGSDGLGFAIPIERALPLIEKAKTNPDDPTTQPEAEVDPFNPFGGQGDPFGELFGPDSPLNDPLFQQLMRDLLQGLLNDGQGGQGEAVPPNNAVPPLEDPFGGGMDQLFNDLLDELFNSGLDGGGN